MVHKRGKVSGIFITHHMIEVWVKGFINATQLGVPHSRIQVELGFILQAETCQILNFA